MPRKNRKVRKNPTKELARIRSFSPIEIEKIKNEIYILCMMFGFGETQIFGVYSDMEKLSEAYEKLLAEDTRCAETERHPQKPIIYQLPLNKFIGSKMECCRNYIFDDGIDDYEVILEE